MNLQMTFQVDGAVLLSNGLCFLLLTKTFNNYVF